MPMFCASKVSSPATGIRTSGWTQRPIRVRKPYSIASTSPLAICRSFSVPMDSCCAIRATSNSPVASASSNRSTRTRFLTWSSSAPGRRVLPPRFMQDPRGCRCSLWIVAHSAVKPVRRRASRTIWAFRPASPAWALMARAYNQALKFGVDMAIPDEVASLQGQTAADAGRFLLTLANKECVRARTVVIASGARYRRLDLENLASFEGSCVHYWASPLEGRLCAGQKVALVGGGNSAGQAAVYLSSQVAKVWLIVRGPSLEASMSRYLVDRITARPNVEILTETTVTALEGQDGILEAIRCRSQRSGEELRRAIRHLFLFIGAEPNTEWLSRSGVTLDAKGFVRTDANPRGPLETSLPGVFAIGDVRSGSVKRVAASVGEGAQVVAALHAFLAEAGDKAALPANTRRR